MPVNHPQVAPRVFLRGATYWADLRLPSGKRHRVSTGKKDHTEALREAERIALEMEAPARSKSLTLWEILEETFESRWKGTRSEIIVRRTVSVIQRELGHLAIADVTYQKLEAYGRALIRDGLKPATVNRRMSCISTALNECVKRAELIQRPQFPRYQENNIKDRYMTKDEERAILDAFETPIKIDTIQGLRDYEYVRHVFIFLLDTGFRFGELFLFRLDGDHADLPNGVTKNNKGRRVPLTKRALDAANQIIQSSRHAELASFKDKRAWDWVSYRFWSIAKAAGCPDISLHILRHTCASRLVQRGIAIYVVSKWLGHSSVKVTERYAKLAPDSLSEALAVLEDEPA